MKITDEHRQALEMARRETDRSIRRARALAEQAREAFAVDEGEVDATEAETAAVPAPRRPSPAERRIMRVKIASTVAELDAMVMALTDQLAAVAEKLDDLKRHGMAIAAYTRWNTQTSRD